LGLRAFGMIGVSLACGIQAEESPEHIEDANTITPSHEWRLPSNTDIHLHITQSVASNTYKRGQHFGIETAEPVIVDGVEIIAKGVHGEGEVIHAEKASMGGRAGELILTARFLRVGDTEIKLKSFTVGVGQNRINLAAAVGMSVGLPGLFITGKNIVVPAGTDVSAKVATDVFLPPLQSDIAQAGSAAVHPAEISREYKNDDSSQQ